MRKAVALAMAMAAAALPGGNGTATAQAADDGLTTDGLFATSSATTIRQMTGLNINEGNYAQYITTDNEGTLSNYESLKKVFFIYNVGTDKFLAPGGYWGSNAALSDEPHTFWLQNQSEDKADQLVCWPYREELAGNSQTVTRPSLMSEFWGLATVYAGSQEGKGRSHAAYTKANYVKVTQAATGTTTKTTALTTSSDGTAFTNKLTGVNFSGGDYFEFDIDLTNCTGSTDSNNTYYPENIISLGNSINTWSDQSGRYNLHVYYNSQTKKAEVHYV